MKLFLFSWFVFSLSLLYTTNIYLADLLKDKSNRLETSSLVKKNASFMFYHVTTCTPVFVYLSVLFFLSIFFFCSVCFLHFPPVPHPICFSPPDPSAIPWPHTHATPPCFVVEKLSVNFCVDTSSCVCACVCEAISLSSSIKASLKLKVENNNLQESHRTLLGSGKQSFCRGFF